MIEYDDADGDTTQHCTGVYSGSAPCTSLVTHKGRYVRTRGQLLSQLYFVSCFILKGSSHLKPAPRKSSWTQQFDIAVKLWNYNIT